MRVSQKTTLFFHTRRRFHFSITGSFIRQINDDAYNQVVDQMTEIVQDPNKSSENKMQLIDGLVVYPKPTNLRGFSCFEIRCMSK